MLYKTLFTKKYGSSKNRNHKNVINNIYNLDEEKNETKKNYKTNSKYKIKLNTK